MFCLSESQYSYTTKQVFVITFWSIVMNISPRIYYSSIDFYLYLELTEYYNIMQSQCFFLKVKDLKNQLSFLHNNEKKTYMILLFRLIRYLILL